MWSFLSRFAQSSPQVLRAVQGFGSKAAPAVVSGMGGVAWATPMIEASQGIQGFLKDRGLIYDPSKDPRVTGTQMGTPLQRARVGDPMILGGKLGYKGADGQWHPRGEILEGDILNTLPTGPGFGTPPVPPVPQLSPEERAYNQERSRIAQLTSATPEERSKLHDEGMRIWAAKYGDLAKKVKPGQSGYDIIQKVLQERK